MQTLTKIFTPLHSSNPHFDQYYPKQQKKKTLKLPLQKIKPISVILQLPRTRFYTKTITQSKKSNKINCVKGNVRTLKRIQFNPQKELFFLIIFLKKAKKRTMSVDDCAKQ